jgi:carbamoyl-phosphate synthase large subunit
VDPIRVLVTSVGGAGIGEQILKALRLAKTTSYTIVGGDMSPHSKGLLEVDHPYILPAAGDPSYLPALLKLCDKHRVTVLFPGSEPELKVISAARQMFEDQGIFLPINPDRVIELCLDKVKTCDFLETHGFDVSVHKQITSVGDLENWETLPVVLKPSRSGGGSVNVYLAQTREELLTFGRYLLSLYSEFIAQEYVGTPESEFTVGVLVGMDGELLNSIAVNRNILIGLSNRIKVPNRTGRNDLGPVLALSTGISQGTIGRFPEVTEPCERLAESLGSRGTINIQCRLVNGKIYVFEINPRFSGTTSLRAMVGYNEPDVLIRRQLLGERIIPHFPYGSGVITRGLAETLMEGQEFPKAQNL